MTIVDERNDFVRKNYYTSEIHGVGTIDYIQETIRCAYEEDYFQGVFDGYLNLVLHYSTMNGKVEGKNYLDKARQLLDARELGQESLLDYYRVYAIYAAEVEFDTHTALEYTQVALKLAEELGLKQIMVRLKTNFGVINMELGNYDIARNALEASKDYFEMTKDNARLLFDYYNLATVYSNLELHDQAHTYYKKSLDLALEYNNRQVYYESAVGLTELHVISKDYESAISILTEVYDFEDIPRLDRHHLTLINYMINTYLLAERYNEASALVSLFEDKLDEIDHDQVLIKFYEHKEALCVALEDYIGAYRSLRKHFEMSKRVDETLKDRTLMNKLQSEYQRHLNKLETMALVGKDLTLLSDMESVVREVERHFSSFMSIVTICVGRVNGDVLTYDYAMTEKKTCQLENVSLLDQYSVAARCINENKMIVINDIENDYQIYTDKTFVQEDPNEDGYLIQSLMYAPLVIKGDVIGFFSIQSKEKFAYSTEDMEIFKIITSYIAIAMENIDQANRLKMLSITDELTGLMNRRGFTDAIESEIKSMGDSSSALMIIDLDHFKHVNDQYGHHAGDYVLNQIAKLFGSKLPSSSLIGRLGGEEFAVLLTGIDEVNVIECAENIRHTIENEAFEYQGNHIKVTISIGICYCQEGEIGPFDSCYQKADKALYTAKELGRNRIISVKKEAKTHFKEK